MADSVKDNRPKDPRKSVHRHHTSQDFYALPHEQLHSMVANAAPEKLKDAADKLKEAHEKIHDAAEKLRKDIGRVEWDSEGAKAFHDWGADMVNAVGRLANYSKSVGEAMDRAHTSLVAAKSMRPVSQANEKIVSEYQIRHPETLMMPKIPEAGPLANDQANALGGPSHAEAYKAQQALEADRLHAAGLMKALAESYNEAGVSITSAERPNFPPMPPVMMPPPPIEDMEYVPAPTGKDGGGNSPAGESGLSSPGTASAYSDVRTSASPGHDAVASSSPDPAAIHTIPTGSEQPPTHTHVNGVVIAPPTPTTPTTPVTPSPGTSHAPHISGIPGGLPLPPVPTPGNTKRIGEPGSVPGRTTSIPEVGGPGLPTQSPMIGVPRSPLGPGRLGIPAPEAPSDGVVGGRPIPRATGQTPAQMPRGTVVGTEPGQQTTRPPMTYGPGGSAVPGGQARAGATGTTGRRLATEVGGVVGEPASTRPSTASRAFTPGGTGLVGRASNPPRRPNKSSEKAARPDYLTEVEETWAQSKRRRTVPPVVD